jgi:CRP-like cAMP-binding protein
LTASLTILEPAKARRPLVPAANALLRALPAPARRALQPRLQLVEIRRRQVLYERNVPIEHAYFIEHGAAALSTRLAGRGALELGLLGYQDLVGVPLVLASERSPHRCVVQVPGRAWRIAASDLAEALETIGGLRALLLRYVQARLLEMAQLAACNTSHSLHQRLARCLLISRERIGMDELPLTHHALSRALGVRRAGVTTAIGHMQTAGIVERGRGRLLVTDEDALLAQACDCSRAIRAEYRRLQCSSVVEDASDPCVRGPQRGTSSAVRCRQIAEPA